MTIAPWPDDMVAEFYETFGPLLGAALRPHLATVVPSGGLSSRHRRKRPHHPVAAVKEPNLKSQNANNRPAVAPSKPSPTIAKPVAKPDGRRFLEAFGTQGARWFAEGKSFAEAAELHTKSTRNELMQLRAETANLKREIERNQTAAVAKLKRATGSDGLAKLAASIELPKRSVAVRKHTLNKIGPTGHKQNKGESNATN